MSRAYRIAVKESLSRHLQVDDGVCTRLELLPLLSKERMAELLAAELSGRGFERVGSAARRTERDGVTTEVDLDSGDVTVRAKGQADLSLKGERRGVSLLPHDSAKEAALREAARDSLEQQAKVEEETLRRRVTEQLEGTLRDLKGELDGVVNRVTATALKQRAAELGHIEEVHEEPNGNLTIKVRVEG